MELIQDKWENMLHNFDYENLKGAITAGLENIRKWYWRMDDTNVYIMCMALNPVIKLVFMRISLGAQIL
jgi:hypothetical protein